MVFHNRLAAVLLLSTSSLIAACAVPDDNVITRASQVDAALTNGGAECRYDAISVSLAEQIKIQEDADDLFKRLTDACPGLQMGSVSGDGLAFAVRTVSVGDTSFSDPLAPEISPTLVGNEGEADRGGSGGGSEGGSGRGADEGGQDGGRSGTESAGGGSDADGPGGDDSGGGPGSEGSQGLGESQGGIGGGNSGNGNGETE